MSLNPYDIHVGISQGCFELLPSAQFLVLDVGLCLTQFEQVTTSSMLYFVDAGCPCFVDAGQIGSVAYRLADGQHELGCLVLALFGCCSVCYEQVDMSTLQQSAMSLIAPYKCLLYFCHVVNLLEPTPSFCRRCGVGSFMSES